MDVITGGADGDSLDGGAGNNTLSYAGSQAGVSINLSTSVVQFGDAEGDKIINFQNVTGSEFNDTLVGDNNANRLSGGGGGDVIAGGGGNDHIDEQARAGLLSRVPTVGDRLHG